MTDLKKTPLHQTHLDSGARMVDFGGWEMPVSYGSQIEEHHAVRRDAGMFDVSHMLPVDVRGAGVRDFLRYALANNVDKLKDSGKALYSCLLNERGTVLDDLIVYFLTEQWFRIVVNAATADNDVAWFERLRRLHATGLTIAPRRDLAMIAVQGPKARARVWSVVPGSEERTATMKPFNGTEHGDYFIARTGYTGEDGFEVMLPATGASGFWSRLTAAGVRPCGLGARDTLRLEAGMNLYGQDMDETVTPLESGLGWTVDLASPRDFVGKAALVAQAPARQLVGLVLTEKGGVLRAHQMVETDAGAGETTSGTFSPTMNASIALARVPLAVQVGDSVRVEIRGRALAARVVKPPFVRHGKVLV